MIDAYIFHVSPQAPFGVLHPLAKLLPKLRNGYVGIGKVRLAIEKNREFCFDKPETIPRSLSVPVESIRESDIHLFSRFLEHRFYKGYKDVRLECFSL